MRLARSGQRGQQTPHRKRQAASGSRQAASDKRLQAVGGRRAAAPGGTSALPIVYQRMHMKQLNGKAIFPTLALTKRRLAKLYSRLWRRRNIDQQSYLPYVGACKRRKLSALSWRWRSADLRSYAPYHGADEAPTSKAIFPTLALAKHRPAKLSSLRWR